MAMVYVNPFIDFGFKKIFWEEASKPILLYWIGVSVSNLLFAL